MERINRHEAASPLVRGLTILGSLAIAGCGGEVSLGSEPQPRLEAGTVKDAGTPPLSSVETSPPPTGTFSSGDSSASDDFDATSTAESDVPETGPIDAWAAFDLAPAPLGLAGFAFVVNGAAQTPMACPHNNWDFAPLPGQGACVSSSVGVMPPCGGIQSVLLVNTGSLPLAYTAQAMWDVGVDGYPPGVALDPSSLAGVLDPGSYVDITSVYCGLLTAVLGSAEPFSDFDAGKYVTDEGTIPWPAGVSGSGGATQMFVAQIDVVGACGPSADLWKGG
jgi:hypothetical protein